MKINFSNFKIIFLLAFISCNQGQKETVKIENQKIDSFNYLAKADSVETGEDKKEFSALVKNISQEDGVVIILDFVEVIYSNSGERKVKNTNSKLRRYKADSSTLIYLKNCNEVRVSELHLFRNEILKDSTQVAIGSSKNGKLESINFGCYD